MLRLVQFRTKDGARQVAALGNDTNGQVVEGVSSTYALAQMAIANNASLAGVVAGMGLGETVDIRAALAEGRVMAPLDHPSDPAHLIVTGTGLTHMGSAEGRNAMHKKLSGGDELTDSMKMFKLGLEGGKPGPGEEGVQPEWFYKGDGASVVAPEAPLPSPAFAQDGGEEPEIAGLYVIGPDSQPRRLGFALGNEFSDHVTEKFNYLWLAHSKLRACSFGPELLTGALPGAVIGRSRVRRGNEIIFDQPFLSGEDNMSHTIANLEAHHFKYEGFRRPGDVHVHFFGTATLSFSAGVKTQPGDVFELEADAFLFALRNPLAAAQPAPTSVTAL
ncbi:MAG: FAH family protein [Alphaproteobacteria bacterium 64-11]|nr:MAG: FAH family protein [Alphaproteobacteria bacterium 64-11]